MSNTPQSVETQTSVADAVVNTDTPLSWADIDIIIVLDIIIVIAIIAAAAYYLYRNIWRKRTYPVGDIDQSHRPPPLRRFWRKRDQ